MTSDAHDDRRVDLPADDDESRREYGRQLAMDALLELALRSPSTAVLPTGPAPAAAVPRPHRAKWLAAIAAICLLIAIAPLAFRQPRDFEKIVAHNDPPAAAPAVGPGTAAGIHLDGWNVSPTGGAKFHVVADRRLQLDRGELHVSAADAAHEPIVIETEFGTATARGGAEFLIGTHPLPSEKGPGFNMFSPMTRVLVLAGMVSLANPVGTLSGDSGHLLAAEPAKPVADFSVAANNGFAFDLYGELARKNPGGGLFFSPYSLSVALAMTAEGARGETAEQMARVLHFPDAARRLGDDAQEIPFNVALIHSGFASLSNRWTRERAGDGALRKQIETLKKELGEANRKALELRNSGKAEASNDAAFKTQALANKLNDLLPRVDQYELRVANALWGEKTYPFRQEYIDTIHRYYSTGGVFPVDFKNQYEAARQRINQWIAEQTNQKISDLIPRNALSPEDGKLVRLILTNAIYFKGEWSQVFSEQETKQEDFLLPDGTKTRALLMHHGHLGAGYAAFNGDGTPFDTPREIPFSGKQPPLYPDDDGFVLLDMPYKGDDLSMTLVAPRSPAGLPSVEKLLTDDRWKGMIKSLVPRGVDTYVPRFQLNQSFDLSQAMKAMGMVRPFEMPAPGRGGAEFDGMCASDDDEHKLYIGNVLHAARVEVTEKGTEAAAATAVIMPKAPAAAPPTRPFIPQFRADRPFAFVIRDKKSDAILFMGRLTKPQTHR